MRKKRVVVTGMGVVSPVGIGVDAFWNALLSGRSGIRKISTFDAGEFSSQIAGEVADFNAERYIASRVLRRMDPFIQFAVYAARQAMEDAGLEPGSPVIEPERSGVLVGSSFGGIQTLERVFETMRLKGPRRIPPHMLISIGINLACGEISIDLGFRGPVSACATACATGTDAIGSAFHLIRDGKADIMVAGASEASVARTSMSAFGAVRALSTKRNDNPEQASRPFDAERDGFVMSEGGGVVILEELEYAKARGAGIYAEAIGYATAGDAYHPTAPDPDGNSNAGAMLLSLADADISIAEVDYINAHGTSTKLGDKAETRAIKQAFGKYAGKLVISSTKSMTGHLLGASSAIEFIAAVMSVNTDKVHPTINYEFPDPDCDLDYVPNRMREIPVNVALSNSAGFGGFNSSIVVKKFKE